MGKPSFSSVNALADPLTLESYHFVFRAPGSSTDVSLSCIDIVVPDDAIEPVSIALFGITKEFPGRRIRQHKLNISFVENVTGIITSTFQTWLKYTVDKQSGLTTVGYKVGAKLEVYDTKGNITYTVNFYDVWPEMMGSKHFESAGGGQTLIIPIVLNFSYFTLTVNGSTVNPFTTALNTLTDYANNQITSIVKSTGSSVASTLLNSFGI